MDAAMKWQGMSIWDLTPDDLVEGEQIEITDGEYVYTITVGRRLDTDGIDTPGDGT